jgi:NitT/TauT family transport system substrate-binding protein
MRTQHAQPFSRRRFLGGVMLAGTAGLLGLTPGPVAAEPPLETTTLRIAQGSAICFAPQYVAADQLFQAEGLVDVPYVKRAPSAFEALFSGEADLASTDVGSMSVHINKGQSMVILGGCTLAATNSSAPTTFAPSGTW